jgi:NDP-sugar pyrophosphorylase family protein
MQTVILAGGLGTRLGALTSNLPKPMVRVAGVPYLEHQLRLLREQGLRDILLLTGYRGDQIQKHFGDGKHLGLEIQYSREPRPLGTGGALKLARPLLDSTFLVIYGDSYLPIDYRSVGRQLTTGSARGVIVVYRDITGETSVPMNIALTADNIVCRYDKIARNRPEELLYVDAGVLAFRDSVLDLIPPGTTTSLEEEIFPVLIRDRDLIAYPTGQRFFDLGTPERLRTVEAFLA